MALQKRERVLVGATGALLVVVAGVFLLRGGGSLGDLREKHEQLQKANEQLKIEVRPLDKASKQLTEWRKRSLPWDPKDDLSLDHAMALYNTWLLELVDRAGFDSPAVTPGTRRKFGVYAVLPFKIECEGTLEQMTRFLYDFYSADLLHKLRWTMNPVGGSLRLVIDVEAVCLPNSVHRDKLPTEPSKRLELAKLEDYRSAIVGRWMDGGGEGEEKRIVPSAGGLFAAYEPARIVRGPTGPTGPVIVTPSQPRTIDASAMTYVDAIHLIDGVPEVWFFVRPEAKTLRLREGDAFEVGQMSGKIARIRIDELDVEIEVDGGRHRRIDFGDNLHQSVALPE